MISHVKLIDIRVVLCDTCMVPKQWSCCCQANKVLHFLFLKLRFKLACSQIWGPIVSCQLRWHSGSPIDPSPHYCQQGKATKIVMWYLIQIWRWHGIFFCYNNTFCWFKSTSSLWRVAQLWRSVTASSSWLLWTVMIKMWENLGGVEKNE